jgi:DNA-3-methyladenine glycosylase I
VAKLPEGIAVGEDGIPRCWWGARDPIYRRYHDREWGRPVKNDRRLFEKICLEGFQSGLSWLIILRKRENFRRAFRDFDSEAIARFNSRTVRRLLDDAGIVRNEAKILATINNGRRCLDLTEEFGSLAAYAWSFEPTQAGAVAMSKDLKRRGWAFVGPTTVYSFMEAVGIVNDHLIGCQMREEVDELRRRFVRPARRKRAARS